MEKDYAKIIANNLVKLRKQADLTQLEVAEKLNYTDKSVSKWEQGAITPSIETLCDLANLYGTNLETLLSENLKTSQQNQKEKNLNKAAITCLAISIVWMVACIAYVASKISFGPDLWIMFLWAVPISCVVALIFNSIWGNAKVGYIIISVLIWTLLLAVYIQLLEYNIWTIFLLGVPSQIAIILWSKLRK